jgi:hypothetical protein
MYGKLNTSITFSRIRKISYSDRQVRHAYLFVRPSAWKNLAPNGRIFMKLDI